MSIKLIKFLEIQQHCLFVALVDSYCENKALLVIEIKDWQHALASPCDTNLRLKA